MYIHRVCLLPIANRQMRAGEDLMIRQILKGVVCYCSQSAFLTVNSNIFLLIVARSEAPESASGLDFIDLFPDHSLRLFL